MHGILVLCYTLFQRARAKIVMKYHSLRMAAVATALAGVVFALAMPQGGSFQLGLGRVSGLDQPVTYFISEGRAETGYHPGDRQLAQWAFEAWQRSAGKGLRFEPASESAALIRLQWAEPGGGQYGETQPLLVDGKRGAVMYVRPDVEALGPDISRRATADDLLRDSIVYLTCVHELGHALGLAHTRDFRDIMYFFGYGGDVTEFFGRYRAQIHTRNDIAKVSGLSDADVARVRAIYAPK
jgi:hypothetical protein